MKILVVSPQPFFSPRGTPLSVYYRTLVTSELGFKTDLLTYGEGQDVDIPGLNIIRIPRFGFLGNVKIGPSFLKLFLDVFIFIKMLSLLISNRYETVHAHEEAVFFAYFLKPFFSYKLIYDMHSSLAQQLTNFKFTTSKLLIKIFKTLEDACLKSADAVITICPDLFDYANKIITEKEKHFLIENSIFDEVKIKDKSKSDNNDDILPEVEKFLRENPDKKIVVYAGTMEKYQGIDILINSFYYVIKKEPASFLLLIGGDKEQVEKYIKLADEKGLGKNIIFTGRVPQHLAKKYSKAADVLVSPRSEGTNTPLKIYEQLASGIPLVATNIYSHTQVLTDEVAFLVKPEPEALANGLLTALNSNGLSAQKSLNAKKLYENKYSRSVYTKKLNQVFDYLK